MMKKLVSLSDDSKSALRIAAIVLDLLERRPDAIGKLYTAIGGVVFEEWIKCAAKDDGLSFEDCSRFQLPYDFIINGHRVQAKSSGTKSNSIDVRPKIQVAGSKVRRYKQDSFDILAVHLASYDEKYFIPVSQFHCNEFEGMVKGGFSRDQCTQWLEAWDVIKGNKGPHVAQKTLFDI
jgi:hypothetical protein